MTGRVRRHLAAATSTPTRLTGILGGSPDHPVRSGGRRIQAHLTARVPLHLWHQRCVLVPLRTWTRVEGLGVVVDLETALRGSGVSGDAE